MKILKLSDSQIGTKEQKALKSIDYPEWLTGELLRITKNYTIPLNRIYNINESDFKDMAFWAANTKPELAGRILGEVFGEAIAWVKHYRELELAKQYGCKNVIYKFKDGWNVIDMSEDRADLDVEKMLTQNIEDENYSLYDNDWAIFGREKTNREIMADPYSFYVFSLRDPENIPHATIKITYEKKDPKKVWIGEVFSKEETTEGDHGEKIHPQKDKIKEFIDYLKKRGYTFGPSAEDFQRYEPVDINNFGDVGLTDQFGLFYSFSTIGGDAKTYRENIAKAESEGWGDRGSYFNISAATDIIDNLVQYAINHNELHWLEDGFEMYENGYQTDQVSKGGHKIMDYGIMGRFDDYVSESLSGMGIEYVSEDDEPKQEDFMIQPDPKQPPLPNAPPPVPILDKEAYLEALNEFKERKEKYEEAYSSLEEDFEPYKFAQYIYKEIEKAKQQGKKPKTKEVSKKKKAEQMVKIFKLSESVKERMPNGEDLALQIKVLKMHLKDNPKLDKYLSELIEKMPSPRQVRQNFSKKECDMLYETVAYLWKKMTGKDLIPEKDIQKAPETLQGCYWMLRNGILLHGLNHYSIAKANVNLMCSLLGIGGWIFQEYLCDHPNKLIFLLIKSGAVRLFINKDRKFYAQCSSETYGKWARNKIRKLDFKRKAVKIIDLKAKYLGWKSGISVIL